MRSTVTPASVSEAASSPAFVSRVSPTVSSVPMLNSSAVSRRRAGVGSVIAGQRSARDALRPLRTSGGCRGDGRAATAGAVSSAGRSDAVRATPDRPTEPDALSEPPARPAPGWSTPPPTRRTPPGLRAQIGATRDAAIGAGHGPRRAGQGRAVGHRRRARPSSPASSSRRIVLVLFAVSPARHRRLAVPGRVAVRLDGLGHPPRRPAVRGPGRGRSSWSAVGVSTGRLGQAGARGPPRRARRRLRVRPPTCPTSAYTAIGDATAPGVEPGVRPLVVGVLIWAAIGLLVRHRVRLQGAGIGPRFGALLGLTLVGALFGAFTADHLRRRRSASPSASPPPTRPGSP